MSRARTSRRRQHSARLGAIGLFFALALSAAAANNWEWTIYPDLYKEMDQFQRAEYDQAARLTREAERARPQEARLYRDAAAQWRKFRMLYEDQFGEGLVAHAIFMEGRTLHQAKDRYKAIKTYTEVLDYFPDELWVAAPALFFRGKAHLDNGDTRKGMKNMKAMYDDADYRVHPLAAGALRRLADNHWRNKEVADAIKYWRETDRIFRATNRTEADHAANMVMDYYIREQKFAEILAWRAPEDKHDDPKAVVAVVNAAMARAYQNFRYAWEKYVGAIAAHRKKDSQAFYDWYKTQRPVYDKAGQTWLHYTGSLNFLTRYEQVTEDREKLVDQAVQFCRGAKLEEKELNERYAWIADTLASARNYPLAKQLLTYISDASMAQWRLFNIVAYHQGQWQAGIEILDAIEALDPKKHAKRVMWAKARIYKERLRKYAEAIQLYQALNEPPKTLWEIQYCYRAMNKTPAAIHTLKEISSMFAADAARSVYTQAEYHRLDNRDNEAIGLYRRILAHPDWTKTAEASKAHQRLEDYGIQTGGGVVRED